MDINLRVNLLNSSTAKQDQKYRYPADFEVNISLDHPYIRTMHLKLNEGSVIIVTTEKRHKTTYEEQLKAYLTGIRDKEFDMENNPDFKKMDKLEDLILNKLKTVPDYSFGFKVDQLKNWNDIKKFQSFVMQAEQIKKILEN